MSPIRQRFRSGPLSVCVCVCVCVCVSLCAHKSSANTHRSSHCSDSNHTRDAPSCARGCVVRSAFNQSLCPSVCLSVVLTALMPQVDHVVYRLWCSCGVKRSLSNEDVFTVYTRKCDVCNSMRNGYSDILVTQSIFSFTLVSFQINHYGRPM